MHPYRGILHTYRWKGGLYIIKEIPNTLTHQSDATNDAPRYHRLGYITWNFSQAQSGYTLRYVSIYGHIYACVTPMT